MAEYIIDAKGKKIGRMASEIALILQDKKNPAYEPRFQGDNKVVVKNISKVSVTGNKMENKIYYRHSTKIGHLKQETMKEVWAKKGPKEILRRAVLGMLPKNKLRAERIKKLAIED